MKDIRTQKLLKKREERVSKCADRQARLLEISGTMPATCEDCGGSYYLHPLFGRSSKCCSCRVAHAEKLQKARSGSFVPKPGYPKPELFQEMSEIESYFSNEKLTCLECGHTFRGLQQHINHVHLMAASDYKTKFGIPQHFGLVGTETKERLAVYMTGVNASLSEEELRDRILKMHKAHPHKGGSVSTAPVILKKRKEVAKRMSASPLHLSKTVTGKTVAPCSKCGELFPVAAWSAVTNACRIKCMTCKKNDSKQVEYSTNWRKKNPEKAKEVNRRYREKMKAEQPEVLKERERLKNIKKAIRAKSKRHLESQRTGEIRP